MTQENKNNKIKRKYFKGHALFNDLEDRRLRAWNRGMTMLQTYGKGGDKLTRDYVSHFSGQEKKDIDNILKEVGTEGYATVKRKITETIHG